MPVGLIALVVVAVLVYFGLLHRALDRMRLSDKGALAVILAVVIGSIFNIRLAGPPNEFVINIGGAVVPLAVAVYLLVTADEARERTRGTLAAILAGVAIFGLSKVLPAGPEQPGTVLAPGFVFALTAGVVGYLAGRSRRAAFIGAVMGIILADVLHYVEVRGAGLPSRTWLGGAGGFDTVILAAIIAVGLAEVVGEVLERAAGGAHEAKAKGTEMTSMLAEKTLEDTGGPTGEGEADD